MNELTPLTLSRTLEFHTCTAGCHCECGDGGPNSTTRNTISTVFAVDCEGEAQYIGKTLAAAVVFATVRFFAGVGPDVHGQGTTLNEAFDATGVAAMVRSFIGMDSIMTLEIRFPIETLLGAWGVSICHGLGSYWEVFPD